MTRNYSKDSEYHSQRNNKVVPFASCNTTAMVMALLQAGWPLPLDAVTQPEDELSALLRTQEAREMQKKLAPWSIGAYPPQEVHACLEWGVNKWMGEECDVFSTEENIRTVVGQLESGGGVVLSGRFPLNGGELGHIISLAGYTQLDSDSGIIRWIIDDPYGSWHSGYSDVRGNNTLFTVAEFERIFLRGEHLWAHLIKRHDG